MSAPSAPDAPRRDGPADEPAGGAPQGGAERRRLAEEARREANWKRWGPYLAERQWGTVREDYSAGGECWRYFPHDHARSRAYRWGEDGLLGISDRQGRLCLALALWNGADPILKERLFGLTNPEGNHGEDVKECYFYVDATPTASYLRALYKYPLGAFPYDDLVAENGRRGLEEREFELLDTGAFDGERYADVEVEYAKAAPEDILIRVRVANRSAAPATLHVLPTLWFRNTWSWGCRHEGCTLKPRLERAADDALAVTTRHETLAPMRWMADEAPGGGAPELLFTENESNGARLWGAENATPHVKDAFHEVVVGGRAEAANPAGHGTKAAAWYRLELPPRGEATLRLRLVVAEGAPPRAAAFGRAFDEAVAARRAEAEEFYAHHIPAHLGPEERRIARQAYAGLLWTKQFYHYVVEDWLDGDPDGPPPPAARREGRNADWTHLYSRDVLSVPDKWEYPWFAAWDLAFHMIPMARVDPAFARHQLELLLREWYMHPNGQIPAYEFHLDDVNPPVHAWAAWRVYQYGIEHGERDTLFLRRVFQKLLMNFTWWVNRKDPQGRHLFSGGFLGLDNIGLFDRSRPLPRGGRLEQADGTAWMGFYCATMLGIALELAEDDPSYEDIASKFFEHFVAIVDAINRVGGCGLWNEEDGFYYDQLLADGRATPLRIRSMVGLIPLSAVVVLDEARLARLPGFRRRFEWFLANRADLARHIAYMERDGASGRGDAGDRPTTHRLLAIPSRAKLERLLRRVLDESEFLSPYGIRSLSRAHRDEPFRFDLDGQQYEVGYVPGESATQMFGGNSNWRGPVWFPVNYLLIDALDRYDAFYGDTLRVECPVGSRRMLTLGEVADELRRRLARLFLPDREGARPCHGYRRVYAHDPHWRELLLYHEYFDGDTGRGCGATHQTGWTALIATCLEELPAHAWRAP